MGTGAEMLEIIGEFTKKIVAYHNRALEAERSKVQEERSALERELKELRRYKDVSIVKSLSVKIDELTVENALLKKRGAAAEPRPAPQEAKSAHLVSKPTEVMTSPIFESRPMTQKPASVVETGPAPVVETGPAPEPILDDEGAPELVYVGHLKSGRYFWNPASGDLHSVISEDEAGDAVGSVKSVKIKDLYYYVDQRDNNVYEHDQSTGDIGKLAGYLVGRKFVKLE